jgi:hypothetical protein
MTRWIVLALCLIPGLAAAERTLEPVRPKDLPKAEVTFRQDGDDLIVSTMVTIYDGPHIVLTSLEPYEIYPPMLRYTVIQNASHWSLGKKTVAIEWRFKGMYKQSDWRPGTVHGQWLVLDTNELNQLGGAALKLTKGW